MTQSLSRFQIIEGNPPNLPHQCAVCGSINGTFIDFQLDLEFYGTVYFCVGQCFTQLANELGYRSPAQHHVVLDKVNDLREQLNAALDKIEGLQNAVAALRNIGAGSPESSGASGPERVPAKKTKREPDKDESRPDESSTEPGSTDVFDNDVLSGFFDNS